MGRAHSPWFAVLAVRVEAFTGVGAVVSEEVARLHSALAVVLDVAGAEVIEDIIRLGEVVLEDVRGHFRVELREAVESV